MSSKYKAQIENLEKQNYQMKEEIAQLNQKLSKKTTELQKKSVQLEDTHNQLQGFTKEISKYQERQNEKQSKLEKIILKANKLVNYFHNAAEVLGKQLSQILHHLLMQIDYDMKKITAKIVTSDVNTLYDWIRSFDNNDYLKKRKVF